MHERITRLLRFGTVLGSLLDGGYPLLHALASAYLDHVEETKAIDTPRLTTIYPEGDLSLWDEAMGAMKEFYEP
jgi:hypothetical protein